MYYEYCGRRRAALAGGLIIGSAGFGNAAGPLLGGVLTDVLSWRWILFVNLPIAALACFVTWRSVHESKGAGAEEGIDVPGVVTLSVGLVALLLALDQVTKWAGATPASRAVRRLVLLLIAFAS